MTKVSNSKDYFENLKIKFCKSKDCFEFPKTKPSKSKTYFENLEIEFVYIGVWMAICVWLKDGKPHNNHTCHEDWNETQ
jgi:hypothetical protein